MARAWVKVNVDFKTNLRPVMAKLDQNTMDWLEDSGKLLKETIQEKTVKDTGATAESWDYKVTKGASEAKCEVFSEYENASFEEFGTGVYAEQAHVPGYRGAPWRYRDAEGEWHITSGKPARHPATNAIRSASPTIRSKAKRILGG